MKTIILSLLSVFLMAGLLFQTACDFYEDPDVEPKTSSASTPASTPASPAASSDNVWRTPYSPSRPSVGNANQGRATQPPNFGRKDDEPKKGYNARTVEEIEKESSSNRK